MSEPARHERGDQLPLLDRRTEIETSLCGIFAAALGIEPVGVDDHFFHLGGHSLLVMQAAVGMHARFGVQIPISLIFDNPTARTLAPHLESLADDRDPLVDGVGGSAVAVQRQEPALSAAQRGIWFLDQAIGRRAAYLLPDAWRLRGRLDVEALRRALETIVARHTVLRTRYGVENGRPRPLETGTATFELVRTDLRDIARSEQDGAVAGLIAEESDRPFDLTSDTLLRAALIHLAADDHVLLLTVHHIASDAWSQRALRRELQELYRAYRSGTAAHLEALPLQYAEYGALQARRMTARRTADLRSYWERQLADLPLLELPADRHRLATWSDHGAEIVFDIPGERAGRLEQVATGSDVTLQMLLVAAYQLLLGRYCGQLDFGVATFASDRDDAGAEPLIGLFVNTIVLRADLSGSPTFRELLARVRKTSLGAYDHRAYPFDTLVAHLRPGRQDGPNPLARAAFQFLPIADGPPVLDGLAVERLVCPTRRIRFDLELTIRKEGTSLRAMLGYSTDLFDRDTMVRFAGHYQTLLGAIVAAPEGVAADLPLLADDEREEQLIRWSGADRPGTVAVTHELFAAQARATPDATALVFGDRQLTYRELYERAGRIGARLLAAGVRPGNVVGIYAEPSADFVAGMVGVLLAGAAYLPLDSSHPVERLAFMLRHAQATALLAGTAVPGDVARAVAAVLPLAPQTELDSITPSNSWPVMTPDDVAYVMFTSGSTGQPKGVSVPHRGITRLVRDTDYVRFDAADAVAFASNQAFDAATFEVWGALLNGARLVRIDRDTILSPPQLEKAIRTRGVTVMFLTAALFRQVAALAPAIFSPLRYLVVGGDVVDPAAARAVLAASPPQHLVNGYGPTENTTFSATYEITSALGGERSIPIGRPIVGSACYVLDARRALLPAGAVGELYLGGSGLAHGYVNDGALTDERFVALPGTPGAVAYRTGDRVRWRADGNLEFLGRIDRQVKLRGHRIELEEIEHCLGLHDAVRACTVRLDQRRPGDPRLIAHVVFENGRADVESLRRHLCLRLPSYMVPEAFVALPALPLTPNGKLDREALPAPDTSTHAVEPPGADPGPKAAVTRLETVVANAFKEVLRLDQVGHGDSFFALGGHSLDVFRMADKLGAATGRAVSVSDIFAAPTVAELSAVLKRRGDPVALPVSMVEVRRGGSRPPLYFPPGALGEVVVSEELVSELPADLPLYAFRDSSDNSPRAPSMEAMAGRLCADLTAFQPDGPICLAGYSFAGLLAYEMARQLTAAGREIKLLVIFDTGPDLSAGGSLRDTLTRVLLCLENAPRWVAEDLIRSSSRETVGRLWRSVKKLARSLAGRPGSAVPGVDVRVEHLFDVSTWSPALYAHVDNNLRILSAFRYGTYSGSLILFRARVRPLFHAHTADLGWRSLARDVRVIETPGNHHTLMLAPHIGVVARKLREVVEEQGQRS